MIKKQQDVTEQFPDWSSFLIEYADTAKHFEFKNNAGEMLRQELNHQPFYIDLIQSKSSQPLTFDFEIHKEQIFLCFMITGDLEFKETSIGKLSHAKEMYYYAAFNKPSIYNVTCMKGINTLLVINISPEWLERFCVNYHNLKNMLKECMTGKEMYGLLPQCRMEKEVRSCLKDIQLASNDNLGVLDGLLRMHIAKLLTMYDSQVTERFSELPYRVKDYLNENYMNPTCNNNSIALDFHVTERTLRNNFKAEFNTTIHDYLTSLRMEEAWKLTQAGKSAKYIYARIGYNDERTFRYKFKKYLESNIHIIHNS